MPGSVAGRCSSLRPPPDTGAAVVRLVERQEATPEGFKAGKEQLASDLLAERRGQFFGAYMVKAKQQMKIEINRENLQRVIG